jgi:hypothetical protein
MFFKVSGNLSPKLGFVKYDCGTPLFSARHVKLQRIGAMGLSAVGVQVSTQKIRGFFFFQKNVAKFSSNDGPVPSHGSLSCEGRSQ